MEGEVSTGRKNMRKIFFLLLAFVLTVSAGFAENETTRQEKYKQLVQQRKDLLNWESEHPMAPKLVVLYKVKEARKIRQEIYRKFPDLREKEINQFRQNLWKELQKSKEVPFITFNQLPIENLGKITKNKKLLVEFLEAYPDNAVNLTNSYLVQLFKENEILEEMMTSYLLYLKTYHLNPGAVKFSEEQEKILKSVYQRGNMPELYKLLFTYASAGLSEQRKLLAQQYIRNSLVSSFSAH